MALKFEIPSFLQGIQTQSSYIKWLYRKAAAHLKRDRNRGNTIATGSSYREAIHGAVIHSQGFDFYTGEELDWSLLSQYNNDESKRGRRDYKKNFELLPSVDHVGNGLGAADFRICGWRTNDCKNDLTQEELISFCKKILNHSGDTDSL